MPTAPDADAQLELLVSRLVRRDRDAVPVPGLDAAAAWGLIAVGVRERALGSPTHQADIEHRVRLPHGVLGSFFDGLVEQGYLTRSGDRLDLTERGSRAITTIVDAGRRG